MVHWSKGAWPFYNTTDVSFNLYGCKTFPCILYLEIINGWFVILQYTYEPPHWKTDNLHRRKQMRRSAPRSWSAPLFSLKMDSTIPLLPSSDKLLAICDCTCRFVSDLVGTQIVGFLTHRLIWYPSPHTTQWDTTVLQDVPVGTPWYLFNESRVEI